MYVVMVTQYTQSSSVLHMHHYICRYMYTWCIYLPKHKSINNIYLCLKYKHQQIIRGCQFTTFLFSCFHLLCAEMSFQIG